VSLADASAVDTTASFSEAGIYVLRLTADEGELQASDDVTITVNPEPTPPAPVIPTDQWVNFYSQNTALNGQPVPVESVITAFDPDGVQCGEFTVSHAGWYGVMPVYGDDPATPEDERAEPGDEISFYIDGHLATPVGPDSPLTASVSSSTKLLRIAVASSAAG